MVCNGEIYNSPEIREHYKAEGYNFRTHTDVEVILPLYLEYGPDCVKHLRGMFALAIWDTRDGSDELDSLLNETVSAHLLSDVEVGVFLSGGIDSSVVAAIAARHQDTAISSFSIGVKDQTFNELPYAQMAAEHCGLRAHEQVVEHPRPSQVQIATTPSRSSRAA